MRRDSWQLLPGKGCLDTSPSCPIRHRGERFDLAYVVEDLCLIQLDTERFDCCGCKLISKRRRCDVSLLDKLAADQIPSDLNGGVVLVSKALSATHADVGGSHGAGHSLHLAVAFTDRLLKPFNFLLTAHVRPFGHPLCANAQRFHLFAPYETDATQWERMRWTDQYSGTTYRITTTGDHGTRHTARVKTYRDVLLDYEWHPEGKCAGVDGEPAGRQTTGLLQRRHVRMEGLRYIGKESNSLEDVESGLVHESEAVYTEYKDPRRDDWIRRVVPALAQLSLKSFERETGKSRAILIDARLGRRRRTPEHQRLLTALAKKRGLL
jgi:hypothetical protein